MEQRALLASALVLGCVTVAAAGGCRAVDQTASSESPAAAAQAGTPVAEVVDPVEGTVADIAPVASPAMPHTAAASRPEPTPRSAAVPPLAERPAAAPAPRTAPTPAPTPTPSRPAAAPSSRAETAPAPRVPASTAARPAPNAQTAPATARTSSTGSDRPSRETAPASSDSDWPSRDAASETSTAEALPSRTPVSEPSTPPAPVRRLETVTIPADAVINVQLETGLSSVNAKIEDTVRARITRDVVAGGGVVIPAGTRLMGSVTLVEEGGRLRERSRLGVRFHTLVLANGTEVRLPTETIYREGESVAGRSAAKIGGAAVGGAILGAIMGGGKGAVIGAATGGASGTGWAMAGERRPAELRSGQALAVRVSDAVSTQVER